MLLSTSTYPFGDAITSACRRETFLLVITTSQLASRPINSEGPVTLYSRPSVSETNRPPVAAVAFRLAAGFGGALAASNEGSTACTYCVLPLRRSSTNSSS